MDTYPDNSKNLDGQEAPGERDNLEPEEMDMEQSDEETGFASENQVDDLNDDKITRHNAKTDDKVVETNPEITDENGHDSSRPGDHQTEGSSKVSSRDRKHKNERRDDEKSSHRYSRTDTNIIEVINVSPYATTEQLSNLFSSLAAIVNLQLYTSDQNLDNNFKVCFVEFARPSGVAMAQHLTNTVFIDRALVVTPYYKRRIPDRETALASVIASEYLTNFNCGFLNQVTSGPNGTQAIATIDPKLTALGLSQYPHLPINTEPARVEEIRRTVYVGNLDSKIPPNEVLAFFNDIGEVKYIRMAGDDTQVTRFAFVEYTHQSSIANALQLNGSVLGSRALKINHSNNAIVKPQPKIDIEVISRRSRGNNSRSRERHTASRHDRDRGRDYDLDRYSDRRSSPRVSKSRRSRSRDISPRRRSRSRDRDRSSKRRRSRSRDDSSRKRGRSRDEPIRRTGKNRTHERRSRRRRSRR